MNHDIKSEEIHPDAKQIAIAWVEGFNPDLGFHILQMRKLAQDIMAFAKKYHEEQLDNSKGVVVSERRKAEIDEWNAKYALFMQHPFNRRKWPDSIPTYPHYERQTRREARAKKHGIIHKRGRTKLPSIGSIVGTVRGAVYERDGWKCITCGSQHELTLDHLIPKSKGGPNAIWNYATMCRWCNSEKGNSVLNHHYELAKKQRKDHEDKLAKTYQDESH